jgi:hypothetical protein
MHDPTCSKMKLPIYFTDNGLEELQNTSNSTVGYVNMDHSWVQYKMVNALLCNTDRSYLQELDRTRPVITELMVLLFITLLWLVHIMSTSCFVATEMWFVLWTKQQFYCQSHCLLCDWSINWTVNYIVVLSWHFDGEIGLVVQNNFSVLSCLLFKCWHQSDNAGGCMIYCCLCEAFLFSCLIITWLVQ